jgi:LacI family transcriptional regulator
MQAATRHLIECGHQRIAFIGRRRGSTVSEQRIAGYLTAMKEAHLPVSDDWIIDVPLNATGGQQGVSIIHALDPRPTAVVCYNDFVAFGVLNELDTLGKRAGRDLAVVGFDDILAAAHSSPPLTSMSVGPAQLGEMASRILLSRINGEGDMDKAKKYIITPKLVVRESSGPMRVPN